MKYFLPVSPSIGSAETAAIFMKAMRHQNFARYVATAVGILSVKKKTTKFQNKKGPEKPVLFVRNKEEL